MHVKSWWSSTNAVDMEILIRSERRTKEFRWNKNLSQRQKKKSHSFHHHIFLLLLGIMVVANDCRDNVLLKIFIAMFKKIQLNKFRYSGACNDSVQNVDYWWSK